MSKTKRRVSRHSFARFFSSQEEDFLHAANFGAETVIRGFPPIYFRSILLWMMMERPCMMILLMIITTKKEYTMITYSPPFSVISVCSILFLSDIQEGVLEIKKT